MGNPILDFTGSPNYGRIRPSHVDAAMRALLAQGEKLLRKIADDPRAPTWQNTMQPLEDLSARISETWAQVEHMCAVNSSDAWRAREMEWSAKLAGFRSRIGQNENLYRRCRMLREAKSFAKLSACRRRIVGEAIRDFELSGVALAGKRRQEYRRAAERLAKLSSQFSKNLQDATNDFALWVGDDPGLGEFPADALTSARDSARRHGGRGLRFSLLAPSFMAFMKYCADSGLRAQMHRAYLTRASDLDASPADNEPVIAEILRLRAKHARLLGFGDYAELALQRRMARSSGEVREFLLGLAKKALPHARKEYRDLCRFAAKHLGIRRLRPWDIAYASEKMRQHQFGYSEAAVREYFTKKHAMQGLWDMLGKLFAVRLKRKKAPVWCAGVDYWEVRSAGGGAIGGLYSDLHARESKRPGAWMAESVCRRTAQGRLVRPVCHIVGNFTPAGARGDSLLSVDDLTTLFHEMGHALHHLLGTVSEFSASGINGVEWDAVEFPSQYVELFLWRKDVMLGLSKHFRTGEKLPEDLYRRIVAARQFQAGMHLMRQIGLALFDLEIHQGPASKAAVRRTSKEVRSRTSVAEHPGYDRFHCGFTHLFDSGYAAGYYSYLWAEVLAADAYRRAETLVRRGGYATAGLPFRKSVLSVGGSRPMMESFVELMGRKPRIEPLLAQHGLA